MRRCSQCGGRLRRVHRTLLERFSYMAIYECKQCEQEQPVARRYTFHFGDTCRCPRCGTGRVVRLKERDHIDKMQGGFLNFVERLAGRNKLYHCRYCRLQFYDRRPLASELEAADAPDTASSDAREEV